MIDESDDPYFRALLAAYCSDESTRRVAVLLREIMDERDEETKVAEAHERLLPYGLALRAG